MKSWRTQKRFLSALAQPRLKLVQGRANPKAIRDAVLPFIQDPVIREAVRRDLAAVSGRLGESGASKRAAALALETFGFLPEFP